MKLNKCDICENEVKELSDISEQLVTYLPSSPKEMCRKCATKANEFLVQRRKEYLDKAWSETARFVLSFRPTPHNKK